jgi:hypothetical protein
MNNELPKANETSDITINTNIVSTRTQCEDTGSVWKRTCHNCSHVVYYSDKYKLFRAIKQNSKCVKCCNKHTIDTSIYYRICPACLEVINYNKKSSFIAATKNNRKCKSCAMSIAVTGRIPTTQARINMSKAQTGRKHSEQTRQKMRGKNNGMFGSCRVGEQNPFYGKTHDEETRKKMRIAALNRIQKNGGGANIGKKETEYFFSLEQNTGWNGIFHGKNGTQYVISTLGYSLDYYEPIKNIVVEYDEARHYVGGKLKEKDIIRMNNIKSHLNCQFFRYNEKRGLLEEY